MFVPPKNISPEFFVRPAATIVGGAFLLSPLGLPFFIKGVPRVLLAGIGGFMAGKVVDEVVDTVSDNLALSEESEEYED
ncbi:MAG: hypothetical protein WCG61_03625 [Chlorobium sp.]